MQMICSRKGQIVFLNSTAGLRAGANISQYAAMKHALKAVADSLREEVNPGSHLILISLAIAPPALTTYSQIQAGHSTRSAVACSAW
jgi:short-subunit dehydrogenase